MERRYTALAEDQGRLAAEKEKLAAEKGQLAEVVDEVNSSINVTPLPVQTD